MLAHPCKQSVYTTVTNIYFSMKGKTMEETPEIMMPGRTQLTMDVAPDGRADDHDDTDVDLLDDNSDSDTEPGDSQKPSFW